MTARTAFVAAALLLLASVSAMGKEPALAGTVISGPAVAIDGDTLLFTDSGTSVRLPGIDAPELRGDSRGLWARAALEGMMAGREIVCTATGEKSYKRVVAFCEAAGAGGSAVDLGTEMVRRGWAWPLRQYQPTRYNAAEREAREACRGVWRGGPGCQGDR